MWKWLLLAVGVWYVFCRNRIQGSLVTGTSASDAIHDISAAGGNVISMLTGNSTPEMLQNVTASLTTNQDIKDWASGASNAAQWYGAIDSMTPSELNTMRSLIGYWDDGRTPGIDLQNAWTMILSKYKL